MRHRVSWPGGVLLLMVSSCKVSGATAIAEAVKSTRAVQLGQR